jgi:hypothetical protein
MTLNKALIAAMIAVIVGWEEGLEKMTAVLPLKLQLLSVVADLAA